MWHNEQTACRSIYTFAIYKVEGENDGQEEFDMVPTILYFYRISAMLVVRVAN